VEDQKPACAGPPLLHQKSASRSSFTAKSGEQSDNPCTPSPDRTPPENPESSQKTVKISGHTLDIADRSSPPPRFGPVLSLPTKKPGGYGFSYSDPFFQDSDDYPDSDEWDPEGSEYQPGNPASAPAASSDQDPSKVSSAISVSPPRPSLADSQRCLSRLSFSSTASTVNEESFNEVVVMRDVGSFHVATPQKALACTAATREDTIRLKAQGKALLKKYAESAQVQERLLSRLERMVLVGQDRANRHYTELPSVSSFALKIQAFLLRTQHERIETGELPSVVEHEVEWAKWLVDASQKGVMHFKTEDCHCRPTWEEEK